MNENELNISLDMDGNLTYRDIMSRSTSESSNLGLDGLKSLLFVHGKIPTVAYIPRNMLAFYLTFYLAYIPPN